jgi:hypothetical protein
MSPSDWVATIGVSILLIAYVLDVLDWVADDSPWFFGLNALGAGIAGASALMIRFWPFVVLEGIWCLVSLVALCNRLVKGAKEAKP